MVIFGKPGPEEMGRGMVPAQRVRELSSRGYSEPDMIDVLRKEGYSADEIDHALTAALQSGITGMPEAFDTTDEGFMPPMEQPMGPQESYALPELPPEQTQSRQQMPTIPETSMQQEYYYPEGYSAEEYVDYAVKEKMVEVDRKISEISIRYKELEKKIDSLHSELLNLAKGRTGEQQEILTKVDSFKDSIADMTIRLSSVEKAFKDTLPALIESVRALSDLAQRVRKEV
jgi:hypothetical protein